jgi:hypothetical protein
MEDSTMNVDVDTLIRQANPIPTSELNGPESLEAQIIFHRLKTVPTARGGRRLVHSGIALSVLGVAAAIALFITSLVPGSPIRPMSAAATTLAHLAHVAAAQPPSDPLGPGQYQYTETQASYQDCDEDKPAYCYNVPQQRQIWIGANGSGRIQESFGTPSFVTPADHAAWVSDGSPALLTSPTDTTFGPGTLSDGPRDLSTLPTDPNQLGSMLSGRKIEGGPPGPAEDFSQIGDLLRETNASPALRSALYKVAETIPGVKLLGTVSDHDGRSGVGLGRVNSDGEEFEYIFDPSTSALLGEQDIATVPNAGYHGATAGTLLNWAVYLSSGIVDSLSATPSGSTTPAPPVSCVEVPGHPDDAQCRPS